MPVQFTYNFEDLVKLNSGLRSLLNSIPSAKSLLLRSIMTRYRNVIQSEILTQNIRYTGTYEQSVKIEQGGSDDDPTMSLVLDPTGPQAARLPIYWKVLEFGAAPSPNVLSAPIVEWANVKLGAGADGFRIANSIRTRGINPHPILSSIFVLTPPDGEVAGLTSLAEAISEEESQKIMDNLVNIYTNPRTGQISARGPGGRFISLK